MKTMLEKPDRTKICSTVQRRWHTGKVVLYTACIHNDAFLIIMLTDSQSVVQAIIDMLIENEEDVRKKVFENTEVCQ